MRFYLLTPSYLVHRIDHILYKSKDLNSKRLPSTPFQLAIES